MLPDSVSAKLTPPSQYPSLPPCSTHPAAGSATTCCQKAQADAPSPAPRATNLIANATANPAATSAFIAKTEAVTAAGMGCQAAIEAERWLAEHHS